MSGGEDAEGVRVFQTALNMMDGMGPNGEMGLDPTEAQITALGWIAEDYPALFADYARILSDRIRRPPTLPTTRRPQSVLVGFYAIDALARILPPQFCMQVEPMLPGLFESVFSRRETPEVSDKLGWLIRAWQEGGRFDTEILNRCTQVFNDSAPLLEPEAERNFVPSLVVPRPVRHVVLDESAEEGNISRNWMRPLVDWVQGDPGADVSMCETVTGPEEVIVEGPALVRVTRDNDGARCQACGGIFDHVVGPGGADCYGDAVWAEGGGLLHLRCVALGAQTL